LHTLTELQAKAAWIIDGYGPLDIIEKRFLLADRIVFIDLPLWVHYWWSTKRLFRNFAKGDINLPYAVKLFRTISKVHAGMRPELLKIFEREALRQKMIYVRNREEWRILFKNGISC
jgi:hypothetical protein